MGKQLEKISVSAGEDLLAFIPHIVGYWPENSIVCIGMQGKRLRATMRLDLPPVDTVEPVCFAELAAVQLASDRDADGCLLAIFGPDEWEQGQDSPQAGIYHEFKAAFAAIGLPVRDGWYVGAEHWRSMECMDPRCCPWPGKGIASIKESYVNTEFIFRGSMVRENPKAQIQELTALRDAEFAVSVASAGTVLQETLAMRGSVARQLGTSLGLWEQALHDWPTTPGPGLAAYLLASLADIAVRDAVIVALATSPEWSLAGAAGLGLVSPDPSPPSVENPVLPCLGANFDAKQAAGSEIVLEDVIESLSDEDLKRAVHDFGRVLVGEIDEIDDGCAVGLVGVAGVAEAAGLAEVVGTAETAGPDWVRLDRAEPLLQFLAASTEASDKAPVLCLLGWIQWCKGRGTWAGHYFQACQAHQPGYRLAALLDELLAVGHIAECAKNSRTAWRGYGTDVAA
ncbi:DUF4192 family protein [Arthrobacter sp. H35-D1]|uniref:DUF4192 family protein n=1 Tax=Arthrobacter sp. H35-D1 TaxID=3046202 RepID=UPI0024B9F4E5|nr:DUF4192 family protein [Arthrobacter sp. H35-D1]MDJ0313201.1 DUF4192 family protein [Arthrobacter sp. H35-D1]